MNSFTPNTAHKVLRAVPGTSDAEHIASFFFSYSNGTGPFTKIQEVPSVVEKDKKQ